MAKITQYRCKNLRLPMMMEGFDPLWEEAQAAHLVDVETGKNPFLSTEFRILRDDEQQALFVRFLGEDDQVVSTYRMHQEPLYRQDVFELFMLDGADPLHYKEIEVSPYDRRFTGKIIYQTDTKRKLDMGWEIPGFITRTQYDPKALQIVSVWKMPYAGFAGSPEAGTSWRFNAFRVDHSLRGEDLQAWQPTGKRNFHIPKVFGELVFEE